MHRVYVGIGSNLGDRRANILAALQRLRSHARIVSVSAFYESSAADGAEGPPFLNVAAALETEEERAALLARFEELQRAIGRTSMQRLAARPIDVDLLVFDDWMHPQLLQRPYNLVPLAEVAPAFREHLRDLDATPVRRLENALRFHTDVQQEVPAVRVALNRAGVSGVRRILRLEVDGKSGVFNGEFSMVADLGGDRSGVHMSRFVENLEEVTLDVLGREHLPMRIERLAEAVAREIVATQEAHEAEVRLRADFALERWTPVSGKRGEETYTLLGLAYAGQHGVRRAVGVEAEGMTACPCAQGMIREHALTELLNAGFSQEQARLALDVVPGATHNQRGRGTLLLGTAQEQLSAVRIEDLVEIVEGAMSSETYDLLKRPDEFFVVSKAHRNPRFVEDVVRAIVARALETYEGFGDDGFLFASQRNDESIHKHDAFAETFGCFGEFRAELRGRAAIPKTELAAWLRGSRCATSTMDES